MKIRHLTEFSVQLQHNLKLNAKVISQIQSTEDLELIYKAHFSALCNYAYNFIKDKDGCRDIVQSVYTRLWENRAKTEYRTGIKSYLYGAVRNSAIDEIRKKQSSQKYQDAQSDSDYDEMEIASDDLIFVRQKLSSAIDALKPKCKDIFELHYKDGLTYMEIANHLLIPKRTVEDNISRAYKQLKVVLLQDEDFKSAKYMSLILLLIEFGSLSEEILK